MIKERGNILSAKENQEKRQVGHLCLLVNETYRVGILPRQGLMNLQREGGAPTTVKSESVMPKRQQNRIDRESSASGGDITRPVADPEHADAPSIKREFMLTPLADDSLHDAIRALSRATGTSLSNSHFLRVVLKVISNAIPEIEREASKLGKLKRPGNARDNQPEREEFEQKIAEALATALQSCPPLALGSGVSRKGRDVGKRTQGH
jgi:hypothetical protein